MTKEREKEVNELIEKYKDIIIDSREIKKYNEILCFIIKTRAVELEIDEDSITVHDKIEGYDLYYSNIKNVEIAYLNEKTLHKMLELIEKHANEVAEIQITPLTSYESIYEDAVRICFTTKEYKITAFCRGNYIRIDLYSKISRQTLQILNMEEFEYEVFEKPKLKIGNTNGDKDKHMKVCEKLNKIYKQKNHDYGNSFSETYKELGLISCITRMNDKMNRLKSLAKNGNNKVKDESISDTLLDLANYSIMTYMCLQNDEKGSK